MRSSREKNWEPEEPGGQKQPPWGTPIPRGPQCNQLSQRRSRRKLEPQRSRTGTTGKICTNTSIIRKLALLPTSRMLRHKPSAEHLSDLKSGLKSLASTHVLPPLTPLEPSLSLLHAQYFQAFTSWSGNSLALEHPSLPIPTNETPSRPAPNANSTGKPSLMSPVRRVLPSFAHSRCSALPSNYVILPKVQLSCWLVSPLH